MELIEQFLFNLTGNDLKTNLIRFGLIFFSVELIKIYTKRKEFKTLSLGLTKIEEALEKTKEEFEDLKTENDQLNKQVSELKSEKNDSSEKSEKNVFSEINEKYVEPSSNIWDWLFRNRQESVEISKDQESLSSLWDWLFTRKSPLSSAMHQARKMHREIQRKEKNIWLKELSKALILYIVFDIFGFFNILTEYSVQLVDFIISIT